MTYIFYMYKGIRLPVLIFYFNKSCGEISMELKNKNINKQIKVKTR